MDQPATMGLARRRVADRAIMRVTDDGAADALMAEIRACRLCAGALDATPTAHAPNPVLQAGPAARILIAGQAPGWRAHKASRPFDDPSGERLRDWLGVDRAAFYDPTRFAIIPMAFCFPGHDAKGGDLPPPALCADTWRARILAAHPKVSLILAIGQYAHRWHLPGDRRSVSDRVRDAARLLSDTAHGPRLLPLPHPSWRTTAWRAKRPWFDDEIIPLLRGTVRALLQRPD